MQHELRQSQIIEKKIQQVSMTQVSNPDKDQKDTVIEELNSKLSQAKKELNDLKMSHTMKCKELEQQVKDNQEIKDNMVKTNYNSKENNEVKKLNEEI
jgi:hypothetical protein